MLSIQVDGPHGRLRPACYRLHLWKWSDPANLAEPDEILDAINAGSRHPALTEFDAGTLWQRLGSVVDDLAEFDCLSNRVNLGIPWHRVAAVVTDIIAVARADELVVYDPQSGELH